MINSTAKLAILIIVFVILTIMFPEAFSWVRDYVENMLDELD